MLLTIGAISGAIAYQNDLSITNNLAEVNLEECEALANCEVYTSGGKLLANCVGDSSVCYEINDNLYCPGKRV